MYNLDTAPVSHPPSWHKKPERFYSAFEAPSAQAEAEDNPVDQVLPELPPKRSGKHSWAGGEDVESNIR